ncbi:tyrosine-type recombinase/integrase [Alphaproteobacteria bacterium]|nr:tyrosine-type recombinase/integrase [Alphaproteobacteria bacterium]
MRNKCEANHVLLRNENYYFIKRVPCDLKSFYSVKRLCFSLKTKSYSSALRISKSVLQRLDDYWLGVRLQKMDIPAIHLVKSNDDVDDSSPVISDALDLYLRLKGKDKDKTFIRTANRNIEYIIKVLSNKSIKSYSSTEAGKFRDWLIEQGMSHSTVKRVFSSVRAIINLAINEYGLNILNPFSKVYLPSSNNIKIRRPIPFKELVKVQSICRKEDDELRWIVALLSDSGMRLSEALGLTKKDINLINPIPHIKLIPHPWRRLKTKSSDRFIPLVNESLWACQRILEHNNDSIFAFPRYTSVNGCNANSASAALNKWLKEKLTDDYVIHGFRHSFRDRLRAIECPIEIIDQLGGWSFKSVGQGYGKGYELSVLSKWMKQI